MSYIYLVESVGFEDWSGRFAEPWRFSILQRPDRSETSLTCRVAERINGAFHGFDGWPVQR